MIKIVLTFIAVWAIIMVSIEWYRSMNKLERWSFLKHASYAALISFLSLVVICLFVIIF